MAKVVVFAIASDGQQMSISQRYLRIGCLIFT
jgi:hypothetical protein